MAADKTLYLAVRGTRDQWNNLVEMAHIKDDDVESTETFSENDTMYVTHIYYAGDREEVLRAIGGAIKIVDVYN